MSRYHTAIVHLAEELSLYRDTARTLAPVLRNAADILDQLDDDDDDTPEQIVLIAADSKLRQVIEFTEIFLRLHATMQALRYQPERSQPKPGSDLPW